MVTFNDITKEASAASSIIKSRMLSNYNINDAIPKATSEEVKFYFRTRHFRFCDNLKLFRYDIDNYDCSPKTKHYLISSDNGVGNLGVLRIIFGPDLPIKQNMGEGLADSGKMMAEISRLAINKNFAELGCPGYVIHGGLIRLLDELSLKHGIKILYGEFLDPDFRALIKRWVPGTEELGHIKINDKEIKGDFLSYPMKIDVEKARGIGGRIKKFLLV